MSHGIGLRQIPDMKQTTISKINTTTIDFTGMTINIQILPISTEFLMKTLASKALSFCILLFEPHIKVFDLAVVAAAVVAAVVVAVVVAAAVVAAVVVDVAAMLLPSWDET
jgi:hypothetical protein